MTTAASSTQRRPGPGTGSPTRRRVRRAIVVVASAVTVLAVLLVVGAWRDDNAISAHRGVATAEVLSAGTLRATISFTTPDGVTHTPPHGVLYPTGLAADQRIQVEYATGTPDLVRVQGRDARLALVPAASVAVTAWLLAAALLYAMHRLERRRDRRAESDGA